MYRCTDAVCFSYRWALASNDPGNFPMLTREKRDELRKALKDRDKDDVWTDRHWQVRSGMDQPVKHCLGSVKVSNAPATPNMRRIHSSRLMPNLRRILADWHFLLLYQYFHEMGSL